MKKKKEWRNVIYPMRGLLRCSSQRKNNKNTTYTTYNPKFKGLGLKVFFILLLPLKFGPYITSENVGWLQNDGYSH